MTNTQFSWATKHTLLGKCHKLKNARYTQSAENGGYGDFKHVRNKRMYTNRIGQRTSFNILSYTFACV